MRLPEVCRAVRPPSEQQLPVVAPADGVDCAGVTDQVGAIAGVSAERQLQYARRLVHAGRGQPRA
eukprot:6097208-Pyramimonas_sp.AAC.1